MYRQSKIDEENRRLKKKSKSDGSSSKKGKKGSKTTNIDENDEDLYPVIKVTRGGELPEGAMESGNEDEDKNQSVGKAKKNDPHRALNIDLEEKPIQKMPSPPTPVQEPVVKPVESQPATEEKPKKTKKKKEEKATKLKVKSKRERSDYKELSPADDERQVLTPPPPPQPATTPSAMSKTTEEKPKKKKTKEKQPTATETSAPLLFDIMSDDINLPNTSNQQYNEPHIYKPTAESDHLIIVNIGDHNRFNFCYI